MSVAVVRYMLHKLRSSLLPAALGVLGCGGHDAPQPEVGNLAATGNHLLPAGYLSTSGSQIVDQNGTPVRLACVGYVGIANLEADLTGMVAAEDRYTNAGFFRIHRATLVRLLAIVELAGGPDGTRMRLGDGKTELAVARERVKGLKDKLGV
jgi:hypothetical protein